jgi:hypothetical protein
MIAGQRVSEWSSDPNLEQREGIALNALMAAIPSISAFVDIFRDTNSLAFEPVFIPGILSLYVAE